jgi:hypothetical protein
MNRTALACRQKTAKNKTAKNRTALTCRQNNGKEQDGTDLPTKNGKKQDS